MKMKKHTLGFSILASVALLVLGCKKTPNVAPPEDSETQSAIDAVWMTHVITDLDMICGILGENQGQQDHMFREIPATIYGPGNGTVTGIRDVSAEYLIMSFNQTKCLDGRLRDGSVFMNYSVDKAVNPDGTANSNYYRVPGFTAQLTLTEYKVDGWKVELYDGAAPAYIYNRVKPYNYNPASQNLVWEIGGKFRFIPPPGSEGKTMIWEGKIWKTLTNTSNPKVFSPKKDAAITWSLATVSYSGDISGMTPGDVPFRMHIESKPLVRDMTCRPYKIEGAALTPTQGVIATVNSEHHPFIAGIASFTTGTLYPREIYFGGEGSPDLAPQCDNTGEVLIKGVSYKVEFKK
jgi:hypothetical protein